MAQDLFWQTRRKLGQNCRYDDNPLVQNLVTQFFEHPVRVNEVSWTAKNMAKSTQFNDNEGNIEMLLRTMISVNQLSICGALVDLCKELDEISSEDSTEDSFQDSESQGTQCKRNIKDETVYTEKKAMPQNARCTRGGNAAVS